MFESSRQQHATAISSGAPAMATGLRAHTRLGAPIRIADPFLQLSDTVWPIIGLNHTIDANVGIPRDLRIARIADSIDVAHDLGRAVGTTRRRRTGAQCSAVQTGAGGAWLKLRWVGVVIELDALHERDQLELSRRSAGSVGPWARRLQRTSFEPVNDAVVAIKSGELAAIICGRPIILRHRPPMQLGDVV